MSAAAAADAPPAKGKKKLLIIVIAAIVLLLAGGGGGALWLMKKNAAAAEAAEEGDDDAETAQADKGHDKHGTPPAFMPLDPFTVNLADRSAERYAQIGITLELDDAKSAEELKAYMPAIRNNILMLLSHKSSEDLMALEGKQKLADEIRRESLRPLGYELDDADAEAEAEAEDTKAHKKKKKKKREPVYPIKAVQFSNFIIQ